MFQALETVQNDDFLTILKTEKQVYRKSKKGTFNIEEFMSSMLDVYNDLHADGKWETGPSKADKIIALTTKLNTLEQRLAAANSGEHKSSDKKKSDNPSFRPVADWRKTKTDGDKLEKDGKTWYWCPHHKSEDRGHPEGLYVTHTLEDCNVAKRRQKKDKNSSKSSDSSSKPKSKLAIGDNLKAVLMTRHALTSEEAEAVWSDSVQDQGN